MDAIDAQLRLLRMKGIVIKKRVHPSNFDPLAGEYDGPRPKKCDTCLLFDDCRTRINYKHLSENFKNHCPWFEGKE